MTAVPASGDVLKWARDFRGLDELEAAEKLGIAVEDLRAYESDQKHPSFTLFCAMASKYRLPQATLFRKTRPSAPKDPQDFRTLDGARKKNRSFEFRVALSNVRTFVFHAERVAEDDADFVAPTLPRLTLSDDPEAAGERERRRIGVSVDSQISWKAADAFNCWRVHLENEGVLVFQQRFPINDGRGFSVYESRACPVVVVNKEETADAAKAFTVWHEYCHLLLRQPGVSDLGSHQVETYCNRFAAAFLIPTEALRRVLPQWPNAPVEWTDAQISKWSAMLKISRRALAIRLEQKGLAPDGFAGRFAWHGNGRRAKSKGGNHVATRLSELGSAYVRRVVDARDRGAIGDAQMLEAIGLSRDHLDKVRHYIDRADERAGVG